MSEQQRTIESLNQGRPRLKQLIIQNFRGIGNHPLTIELDKIVVLVIGSVRMGENSPEAFCYIHLHKIRILCRCLRKTAKHRGFIYPYCLQPYASLHLSSVYIS